MTAKCQKKTQPEPALLSLQKLGIPLALSIASFFWYTTDGMAGMVSAGRERPKQPKLVPDQTSRGDANRRRVGGSVPKADEPDFPGKDAEFPMAMNGSLDNPAATSWKSVHNSNDNFNDNSTFTQGSRSLLSMRVNVSSNKWNFDKDCQKEG